MQLHTLDPPVAREECHPAGGGSGRAARGTEHANGFGALRLLLAALVIVSHTPEMHDGSRQRELLTRLTGTRSFGEAAVAGFFVVSGFLITASFLASVSPRDYLAKRVARIYPGFLVAYALCILVVAPLAGVAWVTRPTQLATIPLRALLLLPPQAGAVFAGLRAPTLNGSMWTIVYEFECYLMVAALGVAGLLRRRWPVLMLFAAAAALSVLAYVPYHAPAAGRGPVEHFIDLLTPGGAKLTLTKLLMIAPRLVAAFLAGACFQLYRDRLPVTRGGALLATIGLAAGLRMPPLADAALALCGGYLILYLAGAARGTVFARINARDDVSYGLYLYAWPIEALVFWYRPQTPLLLAGTITLGLSYAMGWASWRLVERPALARVRGLIAGRPRPPHGH